MKSAIDDIAENHETVIISRSNDKDIVLLSLKDYNSWMETMYLMRSERNMERLLTSIENIEKGNFTPHELIED